MSAISAPLDSIQISPPVCLFQENPNKLASFWDMYQISADKLVGLMDSTRSLEEDARAFDPLSLHQQRLGVRQFIEKISALIPICEAIDLRSAKKQAERIVRTISESPVPGDQLAQMISQFKTRVGEDLEQHLYFCVPAKDAARYVKPFEGWESVAARFKDATDDIEEMSKCLALDRYTAAVFQALLVVEHGLIALGKTINVTDPKLGFDATYKRLDVLIKDRSLLPPNVSFNFIEQVKSRIDTMKLAWRNKVNHASGRLLIERSGFNETSADEVLSACRAFVRYLVEEMP